VRRALQDRDGRGLEAHALLREGDLERVAFLDQLQEGRRELDPHTGLADGRGLGGRRAALGVGLDAGVQFFR